MIQFCKKSPPRQGTTVPWRWSWLPLLLFLAVAGHAQTNLARVALMDFSTDDNSYLSAQMAADFTGMLQANMAEEPGVEWVERAQLDKARREQELSAAELVTGGSPVQRGKWAKADWMITGQFSLDDKNQRTLALEIVDLKHADALASQTVIFPGTAPARFTVDTNQMELVASSLHQLLAEARRQQQLSADKILIAPLFLADVSAFGGAFDFSRGKTSPARQFDDLLARATATNDRVRLIRFPRAYRSLDESEMVLDGLVDADRADWQQTSDLYVWGTYTTMQKPVPSRPMVYRMQITLHLWDGTSQPFIIRETLPGKPSPGEITAVLQKMAGQVIASAHKRSAPSESSVIRKDIAQSLVEVYDQMTLQFHHREDFGLQDQEKFLQVAHILETACFFDPDNAKARVLYLTCRWGWWIDFRVNVKNQFWSVWRRSRAWENYVNRFGLKPVDTELPFPYSVKGGIPALYVDSLKGVLDNFPTWSQAEAELKGFPKDIPPELAQQWRKELEADFARRQKLVDEYKRTTVAQTNQPAKAVNTPSPNQVKPAPPATGDKSTPSPVKRTPYPKPPQMVSAPAWLKQLNQGRSLFYSAPPAALPLMISPAFHEVSFPKQFEVQSVVQLDLLQDKLLILASDDRSAPSTDEKAEVSAELVNQRNRLWVLAPGAASPTLFEPEAMPESVGAFCVKDNQVWIAGKFNGCFDPATHVFRKTSLDDGSEMAGYSGLGAAAGDLFASIDPRTFYRYDPVKNQWHPLPAPGGPMSWSGNLCKLTGNGRWLGVAPKYSSKLLVYDCLAGIWHDSTNRWSPGSMIATGAGFWVGGGDGLHFYDPASEIHRQWAAPTSVPGPVSSLRIQFASYNSQILDDQLETISNQVCKAVHTLATRNGGKPDNQEKAKITDPWHLDYRIPGNINVMVNEGDFLWLAAGSRIYLLHLPSTSMIACTELPARDNISTLAVSKSSVWVGTAYGDHKLLEISKDAFLSVPRTSWVSLAVLPEERTRLLRNLSVRDQALYAFYAGDAARVVALLGSSDPDKLGLEEMFLLLISYQTSSMDRHELVRTWSGHIADRFPNSPWASAAAALLAENEKSHKVRQYEAELLAKYDLNHDGTLDAKEKAAMERDPAYQDAAQSRNAEQLGDQIAEIMKRYDRNGDALLDRSELEILRTQVLLFVDAPPSMLAGKKILITPLLTKNFPSIDDILKKYDKNGANGLGINGLKALAQEIQKQ